MPGWTGLLNPKNKQLHVRPGGTFSGFSSHFKKQQVEVWVQGIPDAAELLVDACADGHLESVLLHLNEPFSAILYDASREELRLVNDRLGMQPLYVWEDFPRFGFSTELKELLQLDGFAPELDLEGMQCFLETGQFLGEKTWFRRVRLLPAATIFTWSFGQNRKISEKRYWSWSTIQPLKISFEDAVEEMGYKLKAAVNNQIWPGTNGLLLSGGLDSRAILAAFPKDAPLAAFTGGMDQAPDVEIARRICRIGNISHHWLPLSKESWFQGRLRSIWITEGQISFIHHHFTSHEGFFAANATSAWVGFIGDLVAGGSWIHRVDQRISQSTAERKFGQWAGLANPEDSFFDIQKEDPFWIDSRCRRFTNVGTAWLECEIPVHKPFIDPGLLAFVYGLPDVFRRYNRLYTATLLRFFPEYFRDIPWQRTGFPIGKAGLTQMSLALKYPSIRRRLGWAQPFVRYAEWIRNDAEVLSSLLEPAQSVYSEYFQENWVEKWLLPHLAGKRDFTEEIGRAVTLEYWLRCIFRKEHEKLS